MYVCFFFFNDTATTEIYTLSLHDALPIYDVPVRRGELLGADLEGETEAAGGAVGPVLGGAGRVVELVALEVLVDRKSKRLKSSHANISYAVFFFKKKKKQIHYYHTLS